MVFIDRRTAKIDNLMMSRMFADTTGELDAMAEQLGLDPSWKIQAGTDIEHFLVTGNKRATAVRGGAVMMTPEQCIERLRRRHAGVKDEPSQVPEGWQQVRDVFGEMQEVQRVSEQAVSVAGVPVTAERWVNAMRRLVNTVARTHGVAFKADRRR